MQQGCYCQKYVFLIAAHPNVKVFVTHGGMMGIQESIYHATPMVSMPMFADQHKNAHRIQNQGIGIRILWEEATLEMFKDAILEIMANNM